MSVPWILVVLAITGLAEGGFPCPKECKCKRRIVNCSGKNLRTIPLALVSFNKAKQIQELNLSHNNLESINESILRQFKHLTSLRLNNNPLKRLNASAIERFYLLREIDLSHTSLEAVPEFRSLSFLRSLFLSGNRLKSLPQNAFVGCPNLQVLYLDFNSFESVPFEGLDSLRSLEGLSLEHNQIKQINDRDFQGLRSLVSLKLKANKIKEIAKNGFAGLRSLRNLNLRENKLDVIPKDALQPLRSLEELDMDQNPIRNIPAFAFSGLPKLSSIHVFDNLIKEVHPTAFSNMPSLRKLVISDIPMAGFPNLTGTDNLKTLEVTNSGLREISETLCKDRRVLKDLILSGNKIKRIPKMTGCKYLEKLNLDGNRIRKIHADTFSGMKYLKRLLLWHNPLRHLDVKAFRNLPSLKDIDLSQVNLEEFLDLTGTKSLTTLRLAGCNLKSIPKDLCSNHTSLRSLQLERNKIYSLPSLAGCKNLRTLNLMYNFIDAIDGKLSGLGDLIDLHLDHNKIRYIGEHTLAGMKKLQRLSLNNNLVEYINPRAFADFEVIQSILLRNNRLTSFPTEGLSTLMIVETKGNPDLRYFPTHDKLPNVRKLVLEYPYHCCYYLKKIEQLEDAHKKVADKVVSLSWHWDDGSGQAVSSSSFLETDQEAIDAEGLEPLLRRLNNGSTIFFGRELNNLENRILPAPVLREGEEHLLYSLVCSPPPDAFYPCDELMGKQWLRVCVWLVFLLALVGNSAVLIVLLANSSKMDVQRLLIINLALADLCLGIYLGFLAVVDITTFGDFRAHAIEWQFSSKCKTAGFLAVFASELSVFTLTVITIERFVTIKYSMYIEKQLTTFRASVIMGFGWLFSLLVAILPLIRIRTEDGDIYFSDYTKYSVCLPFDVPEKSSPAYIYSVVYLGFLLIFNLLAFIVIVFCYIRIYLMIRGSNAFNSGDSRIARRMALLIFTDFACWFPIAVVALSAVFNEPLVEDLWISKVFTVFVFPLNACANPFLYAIFTKQFQKDFFSLYRHMKGGDATLGDRIRRALKASQVNYTSFRRGSSCSFVFGRRGSSKPDDVRANSRTYRTPLNTDDERNNGEDPSAFAGERETCL